MVRSRSTDAHEKVLRAALDLFAERGIEAASMDAIAQQSGVSKATIYNHWEDKEALLMEVMGFIHGLDRDREEVDTGDVCGDLSTVLTRRHPEEMEALHQRIVPALIAYSATHNEFGKAWRNRVMEPPRTAIRAILRRGIERGLLKHSAWPCALRAHLSRRGTPHERRHWPRRSGGILPSVRDREKEAWREEEGES